MLERRRNERRKRDSDDLMTDDEVARMAKVPVRTVRFWRNSGMLPFVKVGRHPRIWLSDFQRTFHMPRENRIWEPEPNPAKMQGVRDIRRQL